MEFCQEESAKILDQFIGNANSQRWQFMSGETWERGGRAGEKLYLGQNFFYTNMQLRFASMVLFVTSLLEFFFAYDLQLNKREGECDKATQKICTATLTTTSKMKWIGFHPWVRVWALIQIFISVSFW